jgi:hypothetical protein
MIKKASSHAMQQIYAMIFIYIKVAGIPEHILCLDNGFGKYSEIGRWKSLHDILQVYCSLDIF